jgi:hypothetical protein
VAAAGTELNAVLLLCEDLLNAFPDDDDEELFLLSQERNVMMICTQICRPK